jgi:hypothetical protein
MQVHCQPYHLWVLAMCNDSETYLRHLELPNVTLVTLAEFETPAILEARGNRTRVEYLWTCASQFLAYVFAAEESRVDKLCYLDADLMFFNSPEPVFDEIGGASIAIAPHRYSQRDEPKSYEKSPGNFNMGFAYFVRNTNGMGCLLEWADNCLAWCYWRHEKVFGRWQYGDQKYLDSWGEDWGAHSIRHKGAHLAPWNQANYSYSVRNGKLFVDDDPLLWFHFHKGLNSGYPIVEPVQDFVYGAYAQALV